MSSILPTPHSPPFSAMQSPPGGVSGTTTGVRIYSVSPLPMRIAACETRQRAASEGSARALQDWRDMSGDRSLLASVLGKPPTSSGGGGGGSGNRRGQKKDGGGGSGSGKKGRGKSGSAGDTPAKSKSPPSTAAGGGGGGGGEAPGSAGEKKQWAGRGRGRGGKGNVFAPTAAGGGSAGFAVGRGRGDGGNGGDSGGDGGAGILGLPHPASYAPIGDAAAVARQQRRYEQQRRQATRAPHNLTPQQLMQQFSPQQSSQPPQQQSPPGTRSSPPRSNKQLPTDPLEVYVGRLPVGTDDANLLKLFKTRGFNVVRAQVCRSKDSGQLMSYGFVRMGSMEEASRAVHFLHQMAMGEDGNQLVVTWSKRTVRLQAPRHALTETQQAVGRLNQEMDKCASVGDHYGARAIMAYMRRQGLRPTEVTYGTLVKAFSRAGKPEQAESILGEMVQDSVQPNTIILNTIIDAWCELGLPEEGRRLLHGVMKSPGTTAPPNVWTYSILVKGYARSLDAESAAEVVHYMKADGIQPNTVTLSALVDAWCGVGMVEIGQDVVNRMMKGTSSPPDEWTYSALIKGYSQAKRPEEAVKIVQEMESLGLVPDTVTYNTLVDAWCHSGNPEAGELVLKGMKRSGTAQPDAWTYNTLVKGWRKDPEQAQRIVKEMRLAGFEPDTVTMNCLVDSFSEAGRAEEGLRLLSIMKKSATCPPDVVTYNSLIKGLVRIGKLEEAVKMSQEMTAAGFPDALSPISADVHRAVAEAVAEAHHGHHGRHPGGGRGGSSNASEDDGSSVGGSGAGGGNGGSKKMRRSSRRLEFPVDPNAPPVVHSNVWLDEPQTQGRDRFASSKKNRKIRQQQEQAEHRLQQQQQQQQQRQQQGLNKETLLQQLQRAGGEGGAGAPGFRNVQMSTLRGDLGGSLFGLKSKKTSTGFGSMLMTPSKTQPRHRIESSSPPIADGPRKRSNSF